MNKKDFSPKDLLKKNQIIAKKSFGQNFILDKKITDKILSLVGEISNFEILEVGCGPAGLTKSILECNPKRLVGIEKDRRFIQILNEAKLHYGNHFEIINSDALKVEEEKIFSDKFKIIANLPYNVGTLLLFKWLKISNKIHSMHLMFQKEVAQRIVAKSGDKHYGRLSIMVNFLCDTKIAMHVDRSVFTPQPKVDSAIVEIIPRDKPLFDVDFKDLEKVVACAFNQRRKMIKSSLKKNFNDIEKILFYLKIDEKLRAEDLTIEQFCKITKELK